MQISFTTSGIYTDYLPSGSSSNSVQLDIADGASPLDVMKTLGFPMDASYLVIVNGTLVPKAERETHQLGENDELMVMPPLKGG